MTKSTITRERLEQLANFKGAPVTRQEEQELARMALATMDSEPVATLDVQSRRPDGNKFALVFSSAAHKLPDDVYFLYRHAQPAKTVQPVMFIDGDISSEDADKLAKVIRELHEKDERPLAKMARIIRENPHPTNECDMPKAQPAPVAPGKWIPVSERMPEVGVKVLCFPVKDEPIHATFNGQLWLQDVSWSGSEEPIDNAIPVTVTHWMPLPAVPQEVKGE
ncbi:DUF551 domain-containing protein [Klebsiella quasipneumoniae]|uniref:DUF551 domain-containing protein n=1 Tax=Klebsiella quasipneumoniae TaxID=1463165 RepID=UPI001647C6AC|nr:DUF551 domain-containing protein [Klebsiella quasipneumoniae]MBC4288195.1 DUF551 domain-containing protein [Klebsiella quasipneumoniae]